MTIILTQIERIRATFEREHPDAVLHRGLPAQPPLFISPNRLNGLLEGLAEQVQHIRQTAGVTRFELYGKGEKQ